LKQKYFRGKLESGELEGMWEFAKKTTLEVNLVSPGLLALINQRRKIDS
jgi:hypothetical protein